jgi:hypothetical protein
MLFSDYNCTSIHICLGREAKFERTISCVKIAFTYIHCISRKKANKLQHSLNGNILIFSPDHDVEKAYKAVNKDEDGIKLIRVNMLVYIITGQQLLTLDNKKFLQLKRDNSVCSRNMYDTLCSYLDRKYSYNCNWGSRFREHNSCLSIIKQIKSKVDSVFIRDPNLERAVMVETRDEVIVTTVSEPECIKTVNLDVFEKNLIKLGIEMADVSTRTLTDLDNWDYLKPITYESVELEEDYRMNKTVTEKKFIITTEKLDNPSLDIKEATLRLHYQVTKNIEQEDDDYDEYAERKQPVFMSKAPNPKIVTLKHSRVINFKNPVTNTIKLHTESKCLTSTVMKLMNEDDIVVRVPEIMKTLVVRNAFEDYIKHSNANLLPLTLKEYQNSSPEHFKEYTSNMKITMGSMRRAVVGSQKINDYILYDHGHRIDARAVEIDAITAKGILSTIGNRCYNSRLFRFDVTRLRVEVRFKVIYIYIK